MAITYKVLGQLNPGATALSTLYTVPSTASAVCSTLVVCNLGLTTTFRIAIQPAGIAASGLHYIAYDTPINQYDSIYLTLGITLAPTDIVSVYSGTSTVAFSLFGSELS